MRYSSKIKMRSFLLSRKLAFGITCAAVIGLVGFMARANSVSGDSSATSFEPTDSSGNRASSDESSFHSNMSGMSTGSSDSTAGSSMTGSTYSDSTSNVSTSLTRNPPGGKAIDNEATGTTSGTSSGPSSGAANGANSSEDGPVPAKRP